MFTVIQHTFTLTFFRLLIYHVLPVLPVAAVGFLAGGAPPCLLVPRHQASSQSLKTDCLHQQLILKATNHFPAAAGGSFSRLTSHLFQKGEIVGRGWRSVCQQLICNTLDHSGRVQGQVSVDGGFTCEAISSLIALDSCMARTEDPSETLKSTVRNQWHPVCIKKLFAHLLQGTH